MLSMFLIFLHHFYPFLSCNAVDLNSQLFRDLRKLRLKKINKSFVQKESTAGGRARISADIRAEKECAFFQQKIKEKRVRLTYGR